MRGTSKVVSYGTLTHFRIFSVLSPASLFLILFALVESTAVDIVKTQMSGIVRLKPSSNRQGQTTVNLHQRNCSAIKLGEGIYLFMVQVFVFVCHLWLAAFCFPHSTVLGVLASVFPVPLRAKEGSSFLSFRATFFFFSCERDIVCGAGTC